MDVSCGTITVVSASRQALRASAGRLQWTEAPLGLALANGWRVACTDFCGSLCLCRVRGHRADPLNTRADALAKRGLTLEPGEWRYEALGCALPYPLPPSTRLTADTTSLQARVYHALRRS